MNKLFPVESDHPLFRYFTDGERRRIEDIGLLRKVDAGDFLIRAGETDAMLFTIEPGHLDIMVRDTVIATVGPGASSARPPSSTTRRAPWPCAPARRW